MCSIEKSYHNESEVKNSFIKTNSLRKVIGSGGESVILGIDNEEDHRDHVEKGLQIKATGLPS